MSDDKIKEIREKLERLTSNIALVSEEMRRKSDRVDEAWAEVEKLRAENARLREALREAASLSSGCPWCKDVVPPLCCKALAGKPQP